MDRVREMQALLEDMVQQLTLVESLREAALSFRGPFNEFLVKVYKGSLNPGVGYDDQWASHSKGLNAALRELKSDVRTAVTEELRAGTFGQDNFIGLCRHAGIVMVTRMSTIKRHKCQLSQGKEQTTSNGDLQRVHSGAKKKASDPYERPIREKGVNVSLTI